MSGTHQSRGWGGEPPWFDCACPLEPCGSIDPDNYVEGCPYHNSTKTLRGSHSVENCPGRRTA